MTYARQVVVAHLEQGLAGRERCVRAFCRALVDNGVDTTVLLAGDADLWRAEDADGIKFAHIKAVSELPAAVPDGADAFVFGRIPLDVLETLSARVTVVGVVDYLPQPEEVATRSRYHLLVGTSDRIVEELVQLGLPTHQESLGVVVTSPTTGQSTATRNGSKVAALTSRPRDRRFGTTIGMVVEPGVDYGYPDLVELVAPILVRLPTVKIEIFGSLARKQEARVVAALAPMCDRVSFKPEQPHLGLLHSTVHFLLAGMPSEESFPYYVVEAQMIGVPVLAIDDAPFFDVVLEGRTGLLFADPRSDDGAGFREALEMAVARTRLIDPLMWEAHLARFRQPAFSLAVGDVLDIVSSEFSLRRTTGRRIERSDTGTVMRLVARGG